jgi:hypothetical protein
MSFGQDVWAAGNNWDDPLFHPSLELNFDLGSGFTGILGTWLKRMHSWLDAVT